MRQASVNSAVQCACRSQPPLKVGIVSSLLKNLESAADHCLDGPGWRLERTRL